MIEQTTTPAVPQTPPPTLLTEAEAAEELRRTPATLRRWRREGCGPAYVRLPGGISGRVLYRARDLIAWVAGRVETHTGQARATEGSGGAA